MMTRDTPMPFYSRTFCLSGAAPPPANRSACGHMERSEPLAGVSGRPSADQISISELVPGIDPDPNDDYVC